jgi:hypothetical protein
MGRIAKRIGNFLWREISKISLVSILLSLIYIATLTNKGYNYIQDMKVEQDQVKVWQVKHDDAYKIDWQNYRVSHQKMLDKMDDDRSELGKKMDEWVKTNNSDHQRIYNAILNRNSDTKISSVP